MNKFYKDFLPEEVYLALRSKGFPEYDGDPGFGIDCPTYADALDWLANNDMFISIDKIANSEYWAFNRKRATSIHAQDLHFQKALDEAILLALEFIE